MSNILREMSMNQVCVVCVVCVVSMVSHVLPTPPPFLLGKMVKNSHHEKIEGLECPKIARNAIKANAARD